MKRKVDEAKLVARVDPSRLPCGAVLDPMDPVSRDQIPGWVTPLAPWGGFNLPSGFSIEEDDGRKALCWTDQMAERALVTGDVEWRDYSLSASLRPIGERASPNTDRNDWKEALVGIVFRVQTSRSYYHFGIEGRHRLVLYRRRDDEWSLLAAREVGAIDRYLRLEVLLDGDGIRCSCPELGVRFSVTDTSFPAGRCGIRGIGGGRCSQVTVRMTRRQRNEFIRRLAIRGSERQRLGEGIPGTRLVREYDLEDLGGVPLFLDFARPGSFDMILAGSGTRALSIEGEEIWSIPECITGLTPSTDRSGRGRLLYGFAGLRSRQAMRNVVGAEGSYDIPREMVVLRGDTGEIVARRELPELDPAVRSMTLSTHTGRLSGRLAQDIVLREWSANYGNGGVNLWTYNRELDPLWATKVDPPYGHGHSIQFWDLDGDGRDELLAGGTLLSPDGEVIWVHDLAHEMPRIHGAQHYDAVLLGNLASDPGVDPVAFLLGGSAGVYVVDGLTGRTRMVHRVGHAQGRVSGKVRKDLPGTEVLVACRWGNMGIMTLLSGSGDRLWSIQPDFIGQGSCPVSWGEREEELIWANTTAEAQALYDGHGRLVKDLPEIRAAYGNRMRKDVSTSVVRVGEDPRDLLAVRAGGVLKVFGPASD